MCFSSVHALSLPCSIVAAQLMSEVQLLENTCVCRETGNLFPHMCYIHLNISDFLLMSADGDIESVASFGFSCGCNAPTAETCLLKILCFPPFS